MAPPPDLLALDHGLNDLATLYQFRNPTERTYGPLTVSHSYCLRLLYFLGPRTMGELAASLEVKLSTMTGVVDQLEDKGLVARIGHPDDRRSLQVALTTKGRRLYRGAHEAFLSHLEPLFRGRTAAARRQILEFLEGAITVIKGWRNDPRKVVRHESANSSRRRRRR